MANLNSSAGMSASAVPGIVMPGQTSDVQLLEMWKRWKAESFDQRWVYERQWMRNVHYMLNRQWIFWDSKRGQWSDKRLAKWIPRPVTNVCKEAVQSVAAGFAAINYGANARPVGNEQKNIVTASVADDYGPILHEAHQMDSVLSEFDWWLLTCGNAFMHTCVNYDRANGTVNVMYEQCATCGQEYTEAQLAESRGTCPACQGTQFQPAVDEATGQQKMDQRDLPGGLTLALSPFEIAFPMIYERFALTPYVIRMRWRDKSYYEQHPEFQQLAKTMSFSKSPADRTMQIFKSLPFQNDLGLSPAYLGAGGGMSSESEGITEYDVWVKPCADFPEGQVIRIAGDGTPTILHSEQEGLPGPLPYHDGKGNPLFTFSHGTYDRVGGRAMGSGLLDPIIQKQDQLNQVDSLMLMIIMRAANPVWLEPKGAEVEKFTGEPGLVVKWNPLTVGGNAKPERIPGENIPPTLFTYRANLKEEIDELSGVYKIQKGGQPQGIETFATINLLLEQGQARHTLAFKSRGACYKKWFKEALEIEREFGPDTRTRTIMKPTKGWSFDVFQKADLSGDVEIIVEDGTLTPKSALGERAAIEHLNQLQLLRPDDPDQIYAIYQQFGLVKLLPGVDAQVQEAWMNMERFEQVMRDPQAMEQAAVAASQIPDPNNPVAPDVNAPKPPLKYRRWYNPVIHRTELVKWCVSDAGRKLMEEVPQCEPFIEMYLGEIDMALMELQAGVQDSSGQPPQGPGGKKTPGGQGPANSNQNAAGVGKQSSGPGGTSEPINQAT